MKRPDPHAARQASDDFDPGAIDELRQIFNAGDLDALSVRFLTVCENRLALLETAARSLDWACMVTEAHHLGGTAGSFGLNGLTTLGRALEEAALARDPVLAASLLGRIRAALAAGLPRVRALCTADASTGVAPDDMRR